MRKEKIVLIFILFLALFLRLYKLNEIPPGLYPDVAIYANDALDSLEKKEFKVFYPENNGREGFWMWILALFFKIFGISIFNIKLASALCGFFTVIGIYFLTKELFKNEKIALFSSFFLSISFWHINLSRIGFRVITYPLLLVFSYYFLIKALKNLKFFDFVIAGSLFGLSFYTYTSVRMQVFVLPILFFSYFYFHRAKKRFLFGFFLFLITVFFVALPLGIYFLNNPQYFISRMAPISVFVGEKKLTNLFHSLILHLGMFNFYGDPNLRHNLPRRPYLSPLESIFFFGGFFISFFFILKKKEYWRESLFLISLWLISLLPGILTKEGIPHGLRAFGAVIPGTIFSSLGIYFCEEKIKNQKFSKIFLSLVILSLILISYYRYFFLWAKHPDLKAAFSQDFVEMGNYLNSLPQNYQKYVVVNIPGVPVPFPNGIPMPAQTLIFIERSKYGKTQSYYLLPDELEKIKIEKIGVILVMARDENLTKRILEKFQFAKVKEEKNFLVVKIENQ